MSRQCGRGYGGGYHGGEVMKFILASLLVLAGLCAGSAGAAHREFCEVVQGDDLSNTVCVQGHGFDYNPQTHDYDIPHVFRLSCLARMEAAMRAMEPYLSDGIRMHADDPEYVDHIGQRAPIVTQWLRAKRDCWTQQEQP